MPFPHTKHHTRVWMPFVSVSPEFLRVNGNVSFNLKLDWVQLDGMACELLPLACKTSNLLFPQCKNTYIYSQILIHTNTYTHRKTPSSAKSPFNLAKRSVCIFLWPASRYLQLQSSYPMPLPRPPDPLQPRLQQALLIPRQLQ